MVEDKIPSCSKAKLQLGSFFAVRVRNQKHGANSLVGPSMCRMSVPWAWGLLVVMGHLPGALQVAVTSSIELITLQAGRCLFAGSEMF